jgi:hypothetical protein
MISMKAPSKLFPTPLAPATRKESKDEPLPTAEKPPHLLTQYSVN